MLVLEKLKSNLEEPEIVFGYYLHDLVYDPQAKDNEKQSALLATEFLEKSTTQSQKLKKVASFIMATQPSIDRKTTKI